MSFRKKWHVTTGYLVLAATVYPQPSGQRPCVILLHAGGEDRHAWDATAQHLHDAGYHVVAYDTRGHGDSGWDPNGRYDTEVLAYDLLAVRERYCEGRSAVAIGHCIGGMTILAAHRLAPARLWAGVVLVDVTPRIEPDGARRVVQFMAAHPDGFATPSDANHVIAAYNPRHQRPGQPDRLDKMLRQREDGRWSWRWDPEFLATRLSVLDPKVDQGAHFAQVAEQLLEGARRITAPTVLVRRARSDLVSQQTVQEFLDVVPHAAVVDVSSSRQKVAGDDDAFTEAVLSFLNRIPPHPQRRTRK